MLALSGIDLPRRSSMHACLMYIELQMATIWAQDLEHGSHAHTASHHPMLHEAASVSQLWLLSSALAVLSILAHQPGKIARTGCNGACQNNGKVPGVLSEVNFPFRRKGLLDIRPSSLHKHQRSS